jgi:hypothetical protein
MDDAQRLPEFLHSAEIPIIAVSVDADRNVEFYLVIGVVGLGLADVPGYTGAAEHDTGEGVVEGVGGGDDADPFGAPDPDPVVGEELLSLVNAVAELGRPLVDVVEEAEGEVLRDAAGADVGGVEAGAGDTLVEFLKRC